MPQELNSDDAQAVPGHVASTDQLAGSVQKRAGFLWQIEACRREVETWPDWMRATTSAPKWMEGWDD